MSQALFVSDIHIKSPNDERAGLFRRFVVHCQAKPPEHLFLVGDIFDLWVADRDYFVDAYREIIDDLMKLKRLGTQIHYFEGNHDLDLRLYWERKLGFDVHGEAAFFELDGKTVRVEHGDQMDPDDRGYLFLRWLLRTPVLRFLGRFLPNGFVAWLGGRASVASRDYTTNVKSTTEDETRAKIRAHAVKVFSERPFDYLVSGHVHVAEDSALNLPASNGTIRAINTGTWLKEPLLFELKNGEGRLTPVEEFLRIK